MAPKFKVGDTVKVSEGTEGAKSWWFEKEATIRAILDDEPVSYEVLFHDAQDFDFIEESMLVPEVDKRNLKNGS
jgi:hypothetical protein